MEDLYQVTITCAEEGKLALQAHGDERNLLLLQPKETNDAGFAMTSSFTSMLLTALLVFDPSEEETKEKRVEELIRLSEQVLASDQAVKEVVDLDFERVIYLGGRAFLWTGARSATQDFRINSRKDCNHVREPCWLSSRSEIVDQ